MQPLYLTRPTLIDMIDLELTAINAGTPEVVLFTNEPPLNDTVTLAGLTLAVGTWYAPIAAVLTPVYTPDFTQSLAVALNSVQWTYSGVSASQVITGYALTDGAGVLLAFAMLSNPVTMGTALDTVITDVGLLLFPAITGENV